MFVNGPNWSVIRRVSACWALYKLTILDLFDSLSSCSWHFVTFVIWFYVVNFLFSIDHLFAFLCEIAYLVLCCFFFFWERGGSNEMIYFPVEHLKQVKILISFFIRSAKLSFSNLNGDQANLINFLSWTGRGGAHTNHSKTQNLLFSN